jgi:hypothetical protein
VHSTVTRKSHTGAGPSSATGFASHFHPPSTLRVLESFGTRLAFLCDPILPLIELTHGPFVDVTTCRVMIGNLGAVTVRYAWSRRM